MAGDRDRSDAFVFFGATGDLAFRMVFPALAGLIRDEGFDLPIIGVARHGDLGSLEDRARQSLSVHGGFDRATVDGLAGRLQFVKGADDDAATFKTLRQTLAKAAHPLHYLAIPPDLFGTVTEHLRSSGCADGARIIVEKPFGRNLASAQQLNAIVERVFPQESIFRIDHYLGKEAVQDLLYFRFANSFLEPLWNSRYVSNIQIDMPEALDVADRGAFYDQAGAIRDVVQNHLFQVVSLLAMEPPSGRDPDAIRNQQFRVVDSVRRLEPHDVVRGQYRGYRSVNGVAPNSKVETFVAMRLTVETWRWGNVPFYIRAGKCLPVTLTEVRVDLKRPPANVLGEAEPPDADYFRFRLTPDTSISLMARAKKPGEELAGEPVELYAAHQDPGVRPPYERLIGDATRGDQSLFARQDWVEAAWRIVDPILDDRTPVFEYEPGSWGPEEQERVLLPGDRWHAPVLRTDDPALNSEAAARSG